MHRLLLAFAIACSTAAAAPKHECETDGDCAITRIAEGSCCPSCETRVVTRQRADELQSANAACRCADPQCAPERRTATAVCQSHRCEVRTQSNE